MIDDSILNDEMLPLFSKIRAEQIKPAVEKILNENQKKIRKIARREQPTWENFADPLAVLEERLEWIWSPIRHLNAVANTPALRESYNACLEQISLYHTSVAHDTELYLGWLSLAARADVLDLDAVQRKIIADTLRDFRLSGVGLGQKDKKRFSDIQRRLSQVQSQFEENVLDATRAWFLDVTRSEDLEGLSASSLSLLQQFARHANKDGYRITLDYPAYHAVMTYCQNRQLRRQVYAAYVTRASEMGPLAGRFDNTPLMHEILALRSEEATLLGYENYAQLALETKMASSPQQVLQFLHELASRSRSAAQAELRELRDFASSELGINRLEAWDIAFVSEALREKSYALNDEILKPYFPIESVLSGLFELCERLFGIHIRERRDIDRWHSDVRFFEIMGADGVMRGGFYLDLYARPHKRGGAWMDECQGRLRMGHFQKDPIAFITCNAAPPTADLPSLLTHEEVLTLFHEFGHGLQHMLTEVDYPQVAGIRGVEWDAVELPSQFMENWCWTDEGLDMISHHYQTGDSLPPSMRLSLKESRQFQSGLQMLRQIEFSLFDMQLHLQYRSGEPMDIQGLLDEVREEIALLKPPEFNRFQHGFTHIFSGGYAAGYYSYKWAEIMAADAFSRFEEEGYFDAAIGLEFLHTILDKGGSNSSQILFEEFRGRPPKPDAILHQYGLE